MPLDPSGDRLEVAVLQIASLLVSLIRSFIEEENASSAANGSRSSVFGSQVGLVLPLDPDLQVKVHTGDRVVAGESVIALLRAAGARLTTLPNSNAAHAAARRR
jgi:phosphatidylserine decarboxylase